MPDDLPRTRQAIDEGIRRGLHIGAQLYASRAGQPIVDLAVGAARPDAPMRTDTLVPWLSAGKPLTAVGLAQLWERGELDLDDRVARFIPEFAVRGKDAITVRHLLTHTGGFRGVAMTATVYPWVDYVRQVSAARLESGWVPGSSAGYHVNSSWIILGEIIRRISGQMPDAYLRQHLFEPLGMHDTWLTIDAARYAAYAGRIALLPSTDVSLPPRTGPGFTNTPEGAATLLPGQTARGPVRELGRFYEMLLLRGQWILRPQTVEALTARHRVGLVDQTFGHPLDWGLGFMVNSEFYPPHHAPYGYGPHAGRRAFGHGGRQTALGMCDPESQLVVALAFNGTPGEKAHHQRAYQVMKLVYEDLGLGSAAD